MIHSLYLKPLPIPVPASLKAMYVYKSKPHDPWDSRQSVHRLLNYDLENIRKSKNQNLTSSHPYLRGGTQVRDDVFLIAIKVPLRSNLTGCMIAWTFVDLEMRGTLRNKTRKPRRNMLYATFRLENYHKCAILTIDDQNRFNADIRHWFACDCANSGRQLSMKAQLLKLMHWPQYMIKIWSVSSRPGQRTVRVKNLLLINEKIKQPCTAGQVQTAETLFARLDDPSWCRTARDEDCDSDLVRYRKYTNIKLFKMRL